MKHVLVAVPRMIFPPVSGGEIRVMALLRALSSRYKFSLITFLEPGKEIDLGAAALHLESLGIKTHLVRRGPPARPALLAPELARCYDDAEMTSALRRIIEDEDVDLVHLEFSQMAQYSRWLRNLVPVVVTEHDSSLLSWGRSYIRESGLAAWATSVWYLRRSLSACDRVVVVSEADAARLARILPRRKLRVVPTGVDLASFPFRGLAGRLKGEVAFVGHYAHYPNEDAAVFLCRDILPELRRRSPGARVALIGSSPTPTVDALRSEHVEVTGTVPEVGPHLARARVFVAPMRLGFGIKGKILEAFASGTPCVATPEACEAMPGLRDGEHLLVARGAEAFAERCARLLHDDALSARLTRSARAYVEERFGWDRQAALLDDVYRETLEERR